MERVDILSRLNQIFEDIIDEGSINLSELTKAGDIDGWDSLTNIQLIVAIERTFEIKFTSEEILNWKNVGGMMDSIVSKLA